MKILNTKLIIGLTLVFFSIRVVCLGSIPILDPSEGRYATISQEMAQSGDYVTPMTYKDGVRIPFMGKPPLFFWLSSISISFLGSNEIAARLASIICFVLLLLITYSFSKRFVSTEASALAPLIFISSFIAFLFVAACLTDPLLSLTISASYYFFALFVDDPKRKNLWGVLFFAALAFGFLTKGPVAIAIVGIGLTLWLIYQKRFGIILSLPWTLGILMFLAIAVPWFYSAEQASPGFTKYFFINENLLRFTVKNYGDLYGSPHTHPYGMIWLMLIGGFFPASFFLIYLAYKRYRANEPFVTNPWESYALLWGLSPTIFFTIAKQVSFYYVLPGFAGLSIFTAAWIIQYSKQVYSTKIIKSYVVVAIILMTGLAIFGVVSWDKISEKYSTKKIIDWAKQNSNTGFVPLIESIGFVGKAPNSAYFYANSDSNKIKIIFLEDITKIDSTHKIVAIRKNDVLPESRHPKQLADFGKLRIFALD